MQAAAALSTGSTAEGFKALQSLRPYVAASGHPEAAMVLKIMDGTRDITQPHRALLILLSACLRLLRAFTLLAFAHAAWR